MTFQWAPGACGRQRQAPGPCLPAPDPRVEDPHPGQSHNLLPSCRGRMSRRLLAGVWVANYGGGRGPVSLQPGAGGLGPRAWSLAGREPGPEAAGRKFW